MDHVHVSKREREPTALYFVLCNDSNSANDCINVKNNRKDTSKKQLKTFIDQIMLLTMYRKIFVRVSDDSSQKSPTYSHSSR